MIMIFYYFMWIMFKIKPVTFVFPSLKIFIKKIAKYETMILKNNYNLQIYISKCPLLTLEKKSLQTFQKMLYFGIIFKNLSLPIKQFEIIH